MMSNQNPSLKAILAENLRQFRKTQGYSQEELANRCELHRTYIGSVERGDVIPDKAGQALDRILNHLRQKEQETPTRPLLVPPTRAPPGTR